MKLGLQVGLGLGPGHIVLDGNPAPTKRGTAVPHFSTHVYCGQTSGWTKMPLVMEVGFGPEHIVLDGEPLNSKATGISGIPVREFPFYGP